MTPQLSPNEIKDLKVSLKTIVDSMCRIESEKELQKAEIAKIKDTSGVEPKIIRQLARINFKQSKEEVSDTIDDVLSLYEAIFE